MPRRVYVFDAPDDVPIAQILVELNGQAVELVTPDDVKVDVAIRYERGGIWGPPLDLAERG